MRFFATFVAGLMLVATTAEAAELNADQSSRLQAALDAQGCKGGDVRVSSNLFEVRGARCGDERTYDFAFDHEYKLLRKDAR
jgi:hypothetical protein